MAENSGIEWTDTTWNPVAGCDPCSPGCRNCYAARMARRLAAMGQAKYAGTAERRGSVDVFTGKINLGDDADLAKPLAWKKPRRVFVNSMSDLFHADVPFEFVDRVFAVMNATAHRLPLPADPGRAERWHTYQVLTKRPDRMAEYMESRNPRNYGPGRHPIFAAGRGDDGVLRGRGDGGHLMNAGAVLLWPLPNVWLGTSVEDQQRADERIPHLLRVPAAVRFLSCEPLLGPVQLDVLRTGDFDSLDCLTGERSYAGRAGQPGFTRQEFRSAIRWVIAGGESGPGARPCDVAWLRSIVRQCRAAGVPAFVKQLGANVRDRNDAGFDGQPEDAWPAMDPDDVEDHPDGVIERYQGAPVRVRLRDKKGGEWSEWPEDLRVREFPA